MRRALPALLAALAILLQGLIPAAALAADHGPASAQISICTAHGLDTVDIEPAGGDKHRHFGGLACEQCVMASFAGVAAEPPTLTPRLGEALAQAPASASESATPGDAAPRPPARAPPTYS
jgi:hypothetical protein